MCKLFQFMQYNYSDLSDEEKWWLAYDTVCLYIEEIFHESEDGSKTEFNNNKVLNKLIYLLNDLKVFNKTIRHIDWNKARRKIEASIRIADKLKRLYNNKYNKNIEYENRKLRRPEICFLKID